MFYKRITSCFCAINASAYNEDNLILLVESTQSIIFETSGVEMQEVRELKDWTTFKVAVYKLRVRSISISRMQYIF